MVYLVDDDSDDRVIVQEALAENSYKGPVLPIENGQALLDRLSKCDPSTTPKVIILDLNMPLLDGFEVLKHLRANQAYDSVQVIVLTASLNREDEIKSFELGCNFFMTKPYKISGYQKLTATVKNILSRQ